MAMVNINRKVTDQFYRYKMPKVLAKVEGKGNGIKTVIVNMVDIGKALRRPAAYPTKYFGCELGAQTQIDKKNDRFIVNGAHDADKLQEILDGFIERFVLCPECENPETDLTVIPKKEKINQQCLACGHQDQIALTHRLTTFILKNPPTDDAGTTPQKGKKTRGKKENHQNGDSNCHSPTSEDPDTGGSIDVNLRENGLPQVVRLESKSSLDDWSTDTSDEAVKNRMNSLTDGVRGLVVNEDSEKTQEERMNIFFAFVKKRKEKETIEGKEKEILSEAERLDVKDKSVLVLAELLFDQDILTQIKKYRPLFVRFLANNHKAQRCLLGAFELLTGQSYPDKLLPKVAHILKAFYDFDYVEEEILISWGEKVSKKYVSKEIATNIHKKAQPFIEWLRTAEEESSDEEEDGLEVVYTKNPVAVAEKETKDDDLDIDAI